MSTTEQRSVGLVSPEIAVRNEDNPAEMSVGLRLRGIVLIAMGANFRRVVPGRT